MDVPIAEPRDAKFGQRSGVLREVAQGRAVYGAKDARWPRSGASREGVRPRDGPNKKNPGDKGRASGAELSRLVPGLPAQGGGAGIDEYPTVNVKYRPGGQTASSGIMNL